MSEVKDFTHKVAPDWCPGCGDFGLLAGVKKAFPQLGLEPHDVMMVSGIGCSSNLPGFINTYGMHPHSALPPRRADRSQSSPAFFWETDYFQTEVAYPIKRCADAF